MIVTKNNSPSILQLLLKSPCIALDTETTGLQPYLGATLFSIAMAIEEQEFYFNFLPYPESEESLEASFFEEFNHLWEDPGKTWFLHNAKFDLAMLEKEGVRLQGTIHDTQVIARLEFNRHLRYSLDACAKRIGLEKSKAVDEYIKKHKLYKSKENILTGEKEKAPAFTLVPLSLISIYAKQDAKITYALGKHQLNFLKENLKTTPSTIRPCFDVYEQDCALTKVCLSMERAGIRIDLDYCQQVFDAETLKTKTAKENFQKISGHPLVDSPKSLQRAFDALELSYGKTDKGNPSFTEDVLEDYPSSLASELLSYRKAYKRAWTYFANFLLLADRHDRLHAEIRMAGTDTSRFSYSDPNLQNVPKDENQSEPFPVRRAFIPTNTDYCLVMIDYDQMEYRLMLEYAREKSIIDKVLSGLDVHQATADMLGISRSQAKSINFSLLYGSGAEKLGNTLGITKSEAQAVKADYFEKLPGIQAWIKKVMLVAKEREKLVAWNGFVFQFPFVDIKGKRENFAYKGPNHMIQGGCAQIVRKAMLGCHKLLEGTKSRLLLQVHDELVFEMHKENLGLIPDLKAIMEKAYPFLNLPLTCAVSHSFVSWADKIKGLPYAEKS